MGQFHFHPDEYLELMHSELPAYERLQDEAAAATGSGATRLLELGTGTGETARRVLADVVVPDDPADAITPLSPGFDLPSRVDEQLDWLGEAGLDARVVWSDRDLAVIVAVRPSASASGEAG
jgi:hypothetical protein